MSKKNKDRFITASVRARSRDGILYEYLKSKNVEPTAIFRAGLLSVLKRLEELHPEEVKELYKKIAQETIVGK